MWFGKQYAVKEERSSRWDKSRGRALDVKATRGDGSHVRRPLSALPHEPPFSLPARQRSAPLVSQKWCPVLPPPFPRSAPLLLAIVTRAPAGWFRYFLLLCHVSITLT